MNKLKTILVFAVSFLFFCGVFLTSEVLRADWTPPVDDPPYGNPEGLLMAGVASSTKQGTLRINGTNYDKNNGEWGLLVAEGRVGIGTLTPTGNLDVESASNIEVARFVDELGNATVIDNNGNVGIGTTSPNYKLEVLGTARFTHPIIVGTPTGDNHAVTKSYLETNYGMGGTSSWVASGTDVFYNGGNVGIGTIKPTSKLDVVGTGNFTGTVTVGTPTADGHATNKGWVETYVAGSSGLGGITDTYVNQTGDTMSGNLTMSGTAANVALGSNWLSGDGGDEGVFVDSAGNVGIGTANPGAKLDVDNGNYGIVISDDSVVANKLYLSGNSSDVSVGKNLRTKAGEWSNADIAAASMGLVFSSGGDLNFYSRIAGATGGLGTSKVIISNTGNVGIGTATPGAKLDINGDIKANFFKAGEGNSASVTSGNWYRIASNSGNRANAEFTLRDFISGGGHSTLTFRVGTSYNNRSGMSFTVLDHSIYSTPTFTKIRVLTKSTYDPQYLEVYVARTGSVNYSIYDNLQSSGWTPIDWTAGSIPSGYTSNEYDVNNLFVVGNYDDRFTINRSGNVGIGTITPQAKLDVNGGLKLGNDTDTCNSTKAGTIRWTGSTFQACNGSEWKTFSSVFACGTDQVIDIQGNVYNTVQIGTQCWMSENMRTTKYPDGSNITKGPSAQGASGWNTDNAWYSCPPNTSNNGEDCSAAGSLGMLYQWSAVMNGSTTEGAQGICPTGWHIPTDAEVYTLENYLNEGTCDASRSGTWGCDPSGSKLVGNDATDQNWTSGTLTNHADFDTSGFNAPAVGYRNTNGYYYDRASYFGFWSSSGSDTSAWSRYLNYTRSDVNRSSSTKAYGFSARCIKD